MERTEEQNTDLQRICEAVENSYNMGGLSMDGDLYSDYAKDVALTYVAEITPQWVRIGKEAPTMPGSYLVKLDPEDDNRISHFRVYFGPVRRLMVSCGADTNLLDNNTAVWLKLSPEIPTHPNEVIKFPNMETD